MVLLVVRSTVAHSTRGLHAASPAAPSVLLITVWHRANISEVARAAASKLAATLGVATPTTFRPGLPPVRVPAWSAVPFPTHVSPWAAPWTAPWTGPFPSAPLFVPVAPSFLQVDSHRGEFRGPPPAVAGERRELMRRGAQPQGTRIIGIMRTGTAMLALCSARLQVVLLMLLLLRALAPSIRNRRSRMGCYPRMR